MKQSEIFRIGLLALVLAPMSTATAQTADMGADFVSRYIWRGHDFGESFSVQPALTFAFGGLEAGMWGSYSLASDGAFSNELDLWAGYTFETASSGSFGVALTDYYFPYPGSKDDGMHFFNYKNGGNGAHWIEPAISYSGPSSFPVSLYVGVMVHNDPDYSTYAEISYPIRLDDDVEIGLSAGASVMKSDFYSTDGFGLLNIGISGTKKLKVTDTFSIPITVAYVLNPNHKTDFLVFGVSL